MPIVSSSGISGWHAEARASGPGVVTGRYGTIGQVFYVQQDYWPLNTTLYVRDFKGNDPLFVSYLLRTIDFESCSDKSSVPGVNRNHLHLIKVALPPLPEQLGIAAILGALDDKIELNRRMNQTLESMAQVLFTSWFVDFDPVRAKMDGRQPVGMDAETAALFPASFESTQVGPVPSGWPVQPLTQVLEVNPTRPLRVGAAAPYVNMANLPTSSSRVLNWISRAYTSGMRFTNGDVLVARITPCLENGKIAFVDSLPNGAIGWGSTEFIVLCSCPPLPLEYAYFIARTDAFRTHAIHNMTGSSGRQRVPVDCLHSFWMAVPPTPVAQRFGTIARSLLADMKANDEEAASLAAIRDSLLPKLLMGDVLLAGANR